MSSSFTSGKVSMNVMQRRMVITMPARFSPGMLQSIREELLDKLQTISVHAVILDMKMVGSIDTQEFNALADMIRMVNLMGKPALFSGLQPGVVSSLIDLDVDASNILTVRDVDEALEHFDPEGPRPPDTLEKENPDPEEPTPPEGI